MATFERRHKDPELHKGENSDRSMALDYIIFRWKGLKAGLHTPVTNTAPFIVTRYPPVILRWQRPSVQLRPHDVPQPARESTTSREANQIWKAHVRRQVRGKARQSVNWALVMESVFPKSFFLTRLLLECSIFKEWLLFHVSSLSVQKAETDWQTVEGKRLSDRWSLGSSKRSSHSLLADLQSKSPPSSSQSHSHRTRQQCLFSVQVQIHTVWGLASFT